MKIKIMEHQFSVCKVRDYTKVDFTEEFIFTGRTDDENSLVCRTKDVPVNTIEREDGWRAFRIEGILDFSLIGILAEISSLLAENKIGIFAVSTYNTDYIFTKEESFQKAVEVLKESGFEADYVS